MAFCGRALLITGRSGAGKSLTALRMLAGGAALVADDRTELRLEDAQVIARAPAGLPEAIEVRGMGLLGARLAGPTPVAAVLDLDTTEPDRLPRHHTIAILGQDVPLFRRPDHPHVADAALQLLKGGRLD